MAKPCTILSESSLIEKKELLSCRGGLFIEFASIGSFSKIMEHVGPIISSRKITCTGENILVYFQNNNKGIVTIKIIGICIDIMYCIAFLRFS